MFYVGLMLLVPVGVALYYKDYFSVLSFVSAGLMSALIGFTIRRFTIGDTKSDMLNDIKKSEALFIVAMSWFFAY